MHVRRAVVCAAALTILAAAPAAAHTDLVSSSPKDGATLSSAPQKVSLKFGEDLLTAGDELVAKDAQGVSVELGPSRVDGPTLSAAWPAAAAAGEYRVSYRAVAEDGHPLEGTVTFSVSAAPAQTPQPAAESMSSRPNLWAPLALIVALLAAGAWFWRSRAN